MICRLTQICWCPHRCCVLCDVFQNIEFLFQVWSRSAVVFTLVDNSHHFGVMVIFYQLQDTTRCMRKKVTATFTDINLTSFVNSFVLGIPSVSNFGQLLFSHMSDPMHTPAFLCPSNPPMEFHQHKQSPSEQISFS